MKFRFLFYLLSLLISGSESFGSQVIQPYSISDLKNRSQLVVHGTVASKTVQRDGKGRIFTRLRITLNEVWHGQAPGKEITVVYSGGTLGEETVMVTDQPDYTLNEEVVLFLVLNQRGEGVTLSLNQGKFVVETTGGEKKVRSAFSGISEHPGRPERLPAGPPEVLTLRALKAVVKGESR